MKALIKEVVLLSLIAASFSAQKVVSQVIVPNVLKISISDGKNYNQLAIRYTDKATSGFDGEYDALATIINGYKMSIYSIFEDKKGRVYNYIINAIPINEAKAGIHLKHKVPSDGKYLLVFSGIETFDKKIFIYIHDMDLNKLIDPRTTSSYEFTDVKSSSYRTRFIVRTTLDSLKDFTNTYSQKIYGNNYDKLIVENEKCGIDGKVTIITKESLTVRLFSNTTNLTAVSNDSIIFKGLKAGKYTLQITNNDPTHPNNYEEKIIEIKASEPINIAFKQRTDATCGLNNGIIVANATGGQAPYSYAWNNGKVTDTAADLKAGIYYVAITDAIGCKKVSNSISISNVIVKADFEIVTSTDDSEKNITIENKSANATIYNWNFGDGEISNIKTPATKMYAIDGEYIVSLEVNTANNCSELVSKKIIVKSINLLQASIGTNKINILLPNGFEGAVSCNNINGNNVYTGYHKTLTGSSLEIDMTGNKSGIYLITLYNGESIKTKKIIYM